MDKVIVYFVTGYDVETIPPLYMSMVAGFLPKPLKLETLSDIVNSRQSSVSWINQL